MIIDNIANASKYASVHPAFAPVFEALKTFSAASPEGKTVIDGDSAFINFSSYLNKDVSECRFESHKKYIDVQYVAAGHERIDVCPAAGLAFTENRLDEGDIAFYEDPDSFSSADLLPGFFVVLFPGEAHRPLVAPDGVPVKTSKAVAKILL